MVIMTTLPTIAQKWPVALASLAVLCCLYKAVRFVRADADMQLSSKRPIKKLAFEDKVVWITGASQGLGEEMAKQFAAGGARLILSSRSTEKLERVKAGCSGKHAPRGVVVLPLNMTSDVATLEKSAATAMEAFGGIHYLVHNAGASQRSPVEEASPESTEALFALNVEGTLRLNRVLLPRLLAQADGGGHGCRIVVIGSMARQMPAPGQAVYAACKACVDAYFRTLHSELWTRGITVTMCHPGPIATGVAGQVRSLYGSGGLLTEVEDQAKVKQRQSPQRVATLVLMAAYHNLDTCWIAQHPVLLLAYLVQYWPSLGYGILNKIGPARAQGYKSGGSGYDINMLKKAK